MTKQLWLNLPVKDIATSRKFFSHLGFSFSDEHKTPESECLVVGNAVVMLFRDHVFKSFTQHNVSDTAAGAEILISIDAESREEVDEYARKAEAAGGKVFSQPREVQGWMYGCAFADPDGHRWNVLYMDMSKLSQ
ncbi:MAG TPA: VOC family protein [Flavobacterium sp.]|jgi:hypothetical protein